MSPRTGRPRLDNPKSNDIKVRIDNRTMIALDHYCKDHKITRAEAIRRGIHLLFMKNTVRKICRKSGYRNRKTRI